MVFPAGVASRVSRVHLFMPLVPLENQAALLGLYDNTWLVFNWPINRLSLKCKPPGGGQTTVARIHFSFVGKGDVRYPDSGVQ